MQLTGLWTKIELCMMITLFFMLKNPYKYIALILDRLL